MSAPPFGRTVPGNRWDLLDDPTNDPRQRTVTVVVAHYEQPRQLARTLAALHRQTRAVDQVLVADDGSAQRPQPAGPGSGSVTVVSQEDLGFRAAAARNLAAARATSDLLVFLDADTTPEPDFVERITRLPALLPELLAVGRRRHAHLSGVPIDTPVEIAGPARELAEPDWLRAGYAATDDLRRADHTSHRFVISAVLACSRWWFEEIGGFDDGFVGYGGEDWELAYRSWLRGGLVAHVPLAVAWHDGPAAGEDDRSLGSRDEVRLTQTLAVADRVGAPGSSYRGLLLGPADLVVTLDPALSRRALTVTLDSLLGGLPRCRVSLPAAVAAWFEGDPRIETPEADLGVSRPAGDARLHLHLTAPVVGTDAAWNDLVDALGVAEPAATTALLDQGDREVGALHDLRQHRRARRWSSGGLLPTSRLRTGLRPAEEISLQGWLEGWA